MNDRMSFIAAQPVQAKAAPSTRASALQTRVSERAQKPTQALAGWRR
jgi:hypothetical protein